MTLVISATDLEAIRRQGGRDYPHETCGLLAGRWDGEAKRVERVVPMPNARGDSPRNRYLIGPDAFRRAALELERDGLEVVGVYHSHPDHPPRPSEFDREHAWPRLSYVILEVRAGRAQTLASWVLADDRAGFVAEPMIIDERTVTWQSRS
ncbi:MAG TPA: M67 family metallopeptidase [Gemmatimonadales bacterium]|nr:M67 family metallopeptidase [Gemmatimonadales bacterium]